VTNVKAALESKGSIGKAEEEEGGKAKGEGGRRNVEPHISHVATIIPYYMNTYTPDYLLSLSRSA
jgi:hypothetical protein